MSFRLGLAALLVAAFTGCERPRDGKVRDEAVVLRIGYTPSEESVADREKAMKALASFLEDQLSVEVELVRTASYGPAVEAMVRNEIDMIGLGPFAYVLASRLGVAEVLAATGDSDGVPRSYRSVLIAHRRAGVSNLDDLAAEAARLRLCFSDPASNSGYLVPQSLFEAIGVEAPERFASVEFTLSHSVSIFNVLFDYADVAAVSTSVLARLREKGRVPDDELVVLWESDALPSGPIAVRSALPDELKAALRDALVGLPERDPGAARAVMAQYQTPGLRYVRIDETRYDGLRRLADGVGPAVATGK